MHPLSPSLDHHNRGVSSPDIGSRYVPSPDTGSRCPRVASSRIPFQGMIQGIISQSRKTSNYNLVCIWKPNLAFKAQLKNERVIAYLADQLWLILTMWFPEIYGSGPNLQWQRNYGKNLSDGNYEVTNKIRWPNRHGVLGIYGDRESGNGVYTVFTQ
jgi:hypothetical protein